MMECYWWAGSLNETPEFFHLLDYTGNVVYPDTAIKGGIYNMKPVSESINLSIDGEVGFDEFSATIAIASAANQVNPVDVYHQLLTQQDKFFNDLKIECKIITVRRDNIFDELVNAYKKRDVYNRRVKILFHNEDAVGDGVTRDAYVSFFHQVYGIMEGENEKLPSILTNDEILEIVGKIITHSFVQYKTFPLKLCRAALKRHLYDITSEDDLINSYLNYLPNRESEMIKAFAVDERSSYKQPIRDILSESRIYAEPTKQNIMTLLQRAAEMTLIRMPFLAMQSLVNGMGKFWKQTTPQMFDAIFSWTKPNAEKVIKSLEVTETCQQDAKVTTFLHRYIRSCSDEELETFVRFITGTTCLSPDDIIKVQYINHSHDYIYPKAETCFKILNLSRNYNSFAQFRENLQKCMSNEKLWSIHDTEENFSV